MNKTFGAKFAEMLKETPDKTPGDKTYRVCVKVDGSKLMIDISQLSHTITLNAPNEREAKAKAIRQAKKLFSVGKCSVISCEEVGSTMILGKTTIIGKTVLFNSNAK